MSLAIKGRILALMQQNAMRHLHQRIDGRWHMVGVGEVDGAAVRELLAEGKIKPRDDGETYVLAQ